LNNILIFTEAGKNIGYGHYMRCSAIRDALIASKYSVEMIVYCNEIALNDSNIKPINWLINHTNESDISHQNIAIIDSYLANNKNINNLKSKYKIYKTIVIDDYNRINYNADYLINPNVYFSEIDYSNQSAKCIGGKQYVILRSAFRNAPQKKIKKNVSSILVSLGGSDFRNLLPPFLTLASKFNSICWQIIDPENKKYDLIPSNCKMHQVVSPEMMLDLIINSDIVISGCGQTLHELSVLKTPSIGICLDIDQKYNQQYYLDAGFLLEKNNWDDENLFLRIESQIISLKSFSLREKIHADCKDLINKNGIFEIVSLIQYLNK
jgi:spore coat polysaccharide biosynthesis predicted glycosyltransferase SpsG